MVVGFTKVLLCNDERISAERDGTALKPMEPHTMPTSFRLTTYDESLSDGVDNMPPRAAIQIVKRVWERIAPLQLAERSWDNVSFILTRNHRSVQVTC